MREQFAATDRKVFTRSRFSGREYVGGVVDAEMTLPDGRTLAYSVIGDPEGAPVFYCHGAPGGRLELATLDDAFAEHHIRLITADRPGYGGSSPLRGRTTAAWAADVTSLADHLDVRRFGILGLSSGGPYTVACAALLGDRVMGAVVAAGNTDMSWPEAADGYLETELRIMAMDDEDAAVADCIERFGPGGERFFEGDADLGPADDAFLADPEKATGLFTAMAEAFRQGVTGYAHDITVQGRAWDFDPAAISTPVIVVHGELDRLVPITHSFHTADLIPGSEMRVFPDRGHLSLVEEFPALAAEITEITEITPDPA